MSEEEIIKQVKDYLQGKKMRYGKYYKHNNNFTAIQDLLDLHKKEKEKNKKLEEENYQLAEKNLMLKLEQKSTPVIELVDYIRKDKIREKIKEYHDFFIEYPEEYRKAKLRAVEVVLQELLEEEE